MTKPNRLQSALNKEAQVPAPFSKPEAEKQTEVAVNKNTSRASKVMISAYMPKEVRSSFHLIQAKLPERQLQDLMAEAFNDLFAKYNVPQTAKL
jgi:hypothetical protein